MILMATLGPKARAAVDAGRDPLRGTDADLQRIEAALRARLGADILPPDGAPPPTPRGIGWRIVSPAIGVCVIGGALLLALRSESKPVVQHKAISQQSPDPALSAPAATLAAPPAATSPTAPDVSPSAELASPVPSAAAAGIATRRREGDPLAQEVALLSRGTTALKQGRIGEALKALDEHQRLFPNGVLSEERRAAKAQALCASGRVTEGRAQLGSLLARSPAGKRAKQVCDAISTPGREVGDK